MSTSTFETIIPGITLTSTGISLPDGLSFEDYQIVMSSLSKTGDAVRWAMGDLLNFGRNKYGRKYTDAIELTSWSLQTLKIFCVVSKKFPADRRRADVPYWVYAEIANCAYRPEERDVWINGWAKHPTSQTQFREIRRLVAADRFEREVLSTIKERDCTNIGTLSEPTSSISDVVHSEQCTNSARTMGEVRLLPNPVSESDSDSVSESGTVSGEDLPVGNGHLSGEWQPMTVYVKHESNKTWLIEPCAMLREGCQGYLLVVNGVIVEEGPDVDRLMKKAEGASCE